VRPAGDIHYQPYNVNHNKHTDWRKGTWIANKPMNLRLEVINFRTLPRVKNKEESSMGILYVYDFMSSLKKKGEPAFD
jgi:hypothetical protein